MQSKNVKREQVARNPSLSCSVSVDVEDWGD